MEKLPQYIASFADANILPNFRLSSTISPIRRLMKNLLCTATIRVGSGLNEEFTLSTLLKLHKAVNKFKLRLVDLSARHQLELRKMFDRCSMTV